LRYPTTSVQVICEGGDVERSVTEQLPVGPCGRASYSKTNGSCCAGGVEGVATGPVGTAVGEDPDVSGWAVSVGRTGDGGVGGSDGVVVSDAGSHLVGPGDVDSAGAGDSGDTGVDVGVAVGIGLVGALDGLAVRVAVGVAVGVVGAGAQGTISRGDAWSPPAPPV
jgi:hypothetical protein